MARIPSHGQSLFPGWIRPSSLGSAIIRAEDIDWQNLVADPQGLADIQSFLSAQLGVYVQRIGGLTYSGNQLHLAYNDESGASQTVSVDITSVAQGVVPIVGHTEGWVPTRIPVSDYDVADTAIGVYRAANDLIMIADASGHLNGVTINDPGSGSPWTNYAANDLVHFWGRRDPVFVGQTQVAWEHLHYATKSGSHSGQHVHETENGQIYGIAVDGENVWLLLWDPTFNHVRLVTYSIDANGAQDPAPNQTIADTVITSHMPAGATLPDDLGGIVHAHGRIYVLVRGANPDGLPVTQALAYGTTHPFARESAHDRFYGVSSDVVDGYFTDDTDWILQSHWLVKYLASTMLGHNDTPDAFGNAGLPLVVASSGTDTVFDRLEASALGNPLTQIGDSLQLATDSLTPIEDEDFTEYEYLVIFVRDAFNRISTPAIIPYAKINDLTATTATTLAAAGNNALKITAHLDGHRVVYGIVRRTATGISLGQLHEAQEPWTPNLIATSINTGNIEDWDAIILSLNPQAVFEWPSAPANGWFGITFGDENYAINWFLASDLFAKTRLNSQTDTPTDGNSIIIAGALGERSIRLGRRTAGPITDAAEVWASHSGHSPWPIRVYRSWTSGITNLIVHAEVFGLGRR